MAGRILVVDDDATIASSIARYLAREHEDVVALTSAREALRRIVAGERFDAIVCDLKMPDMGGMDFFDQLLAGHPSQSEAIIFMTGGAFTPGIREFLAAVPNARLEKPFPAHELRALVRGRLLQAGKV